MGEKYLFSIFSFQDKEFYSPNNYNFLPINNANYNNYEIIFMRYNLIILNNYKQKIFYIIEYGNFNYFLLLKSYNYY